MFRKIIRIIRTAFLVKKNRQLIMLTLFFEIILCNMTLNHGRELIERIGFYPECNAFSLIWNDTFFMMLFFFIVIFAFSNAPFRERVGSYVMIRSGKRLYVFAHVIYISILSFLIPVFLYIVNAFFLPYRQGNGEWGQFWGAISQNSEVYADLNYISLDYRVLWDFTPKETLQHTMCICFLLCFMTGLLLYLTALRGRKKMGIIFIVSLVTMSRISVFYRMFRLYWVNPFTWICLNILTPENNGILVNVFYAKAILCMIDVILIMGILITSYKKRSYDERA